MKKQLLKGIILHYANESHELFASFKRGLGGNMQFVIEFNARVVYMAKTFESFKKELERLVFVHELELIEEKA